MVVGVGIVRVTFPLFDLVDLFMHAVFLSHTAYYQLKGLLQVCMYTFISSYE